MSKAAKRWVTIREFAECFGYESRYVLTLVQTGRIPAIRLQYSDGRGGDWRIDLEAVAMENNGYDESDHSMDSRQGISRSTAAGSRKLPSTSSNHTLIERLIESIDQI